MKTVVVSGVSGNLGRAVVNRFIEGSYRVIGTVIPNDSAALNIMDKQFESMDVDLMNEENTAHFVNAVITKYAHIDVAVLTVGGFAMGTISETKTSDINKQYKLNFETAYNLARPVFQQMLKQSSGRIFLIGSKPGLDCKNSSGMVAYGLAKSLIFRLAELMNAEAQGTNVVTGVVVPGTIDTAANRQSMPDANFDNWVKAEQLAELIFFYSSETASVIREPVVKAYNNS